MPEAGGIGKHARVFYDHRLLKHIQPYLEPSPPGVLPIWRIYGPLAYTENMTFWEMVRGGYWRAIWMRLRHGVRPQRFIRLEGPELPKTIVWRSYVPEEVLGVGGGEDGGEEAPF